MNTRSSKICIENENFLFHLYEEKLDGSIHLELRRLYEGHDTEEFINVIIVLRVLRPFHRR